MLSVQRFLWLGWLSTPGTLRLLQQGRWTGIQGRRAQKGLPKELPHPPPSLSLLWQLLQKTFRLQHLALWELSLFFMCMG